MKNSSRIIWILSLLCVLSGSLMIVGLCVNKKEIAEFIPPQFDETVMEGVPPIDESGQFGWAEIGQQGMPYRVAVCGEIQSVDETAFIYLTNYAENSIWLKLRVFDREGNTIAETGLVKPGEYIEKVNFFRTLKNGEKIRLKIMAYEPETYYSAGAVVLNTTVKTGEW